MSGLIEDVRFAFRKLAKSPGFTAVAVLTLALGIGANTAIFSVVNSQLLQPLPYPEPEDVVIIWETSEKFGAMSISYPNFKDWQKRTETMEEIAVYRRDRFNLTGVGDPEQVRTTMISANMFDAVGLPPVIGRAFTADEDTVGGAPVAVLAHGYWVRRFGGELDVIGRQISLNDTLYEIVGIASPDMIHPTRSDVFVPIAPFSDHEAWQNRGNHPGIYGIGRVGPGHTINEAQAEITTIAAALAEEYPTTNTGVSVQFSSLSEYIVEDVRPALMMLVGAVGLVLLIACVNIANLLLARSAGRERELATRTAVGASRGRIVRQLLTEATLLSLFGGALGILVAYGGLDALTALYGSSLPRTDPIAMDSRVLSFTAFLSISTGLLFGLVPAFQSTAQSAAQPLRSGARGSMGKRQSRLQYTLVGTEIALAVVLLIGSGLLIRSFANVLEVDPGFEPDNVLTASVNLPESKYPDDEAVRRFWDEALPRIESLPGAVSVGTTNNLPFVGGNQTSFAIVGRERPEPGQFPFAEYAMVTTDYFRTIDMRLLRGRLFDERDHAEAPQVMVIDQQFADRHWPGEEPIGQQVDLGAHGEADIAEVIGVVATVRHNGLDVEPPRPQMYFTVAQAASSDVTVLVKTAVPPTDLIEPLREAILAVDPAQPIRDAQAYNDIVGESLGDRRLSLSLLTTFALIAVALALIGVYGVISYSVSRRTQEFGVRIALGSGDRHIFGLVISQVAKVALAGVAIGLLGAVVVSGLLSQQLFGVSRFDASTFVAVPLVIVACAIVACLLPARRAVRIKPVVALRQD